MQKELVDKKCEKKASQQPWVTSVWKGGFCKGGGKLIRDSFLMEPLGYWVCKIWSFENNFTFASGGLRRTIVKN